LYTADLIEFRNDATNIDQYLQMVFAPF